MNATRRNVAIISPSGNAYSETFIQAHRERLQGNVLYYFGDRDKQSLLGEGYLLSGLPKFAKKLSSRITRKPFAAENSALKNSWTRHGVEVVLAEYGTTGADYLDIISEANLPLVVHFHGFDASMHHILSSYQSRYRELFDYASYIIVVSEVMYAKILSLGCPPEKLILNQYGPNPDFHSLKPAFTTQRFIAVGRFTKKKAPHHTIAAFQKVLKHHPEAQLVMAGTGSLLEPSRSLVDELGITKSVAFPGVIAPAQFIDYLQNSIAFVQHSVTAESGDMEGTPLTVLEASAAGLPVVSTLHAGIPDVIINNETGFLVEENDVENMAEAMIKLLDDPREAYLMGFRGSEHIAQNFSLDRHIACIDGLLSSAITG